MQTKHELLQKIIKGALSGMRQFLATETTLKMMENASISP